MTQPEAQQEKEPQLTTRQRAFVERYLANGFNATEAARHVGYAERSAASIGSENLRKPEIKAAIRHRMQAAAMDADEALARLADQARASMADFLSFEDVSVPSADGAPATLRRVWRLDLGKAEAAGKLHLIAQYRKTENGEIIRLHDPQAALINILRVHGLLSAIDWSKIPQQIIDGLAAGTLTADDLRRLTS